MAETKSGSIKEILSFLLGWIKSPLKVGAVVPSSRALADRAVAHLRTSENGWVVELGAGTGSFTQALIESGIPTSRFVAVEIDPNYCKLLRKKCPNIEVVEGDAMALASVIPAEAVGQVTTLISGIPLLTMPPEVRRAYIESCLSVLHPEGQLLQYTYSPVSPINAREMGLKKKRLAFVWANVPPASVWQYEIAA